MLTLLIVVSLLYVAIFVVLWFLHRMERRRVKPAPGHRRVIPYDQHLYVEAPTEREALEAFLVADLDLAERGR